MGGQPIEILSEVDAFVACAAKLARELPNPAQFRPYSGILRLCRRGQVFDHMDLSPIGDQVTALD
jgi:hypothetical protein